jgi:hypothetical protein
LSRLGKRGERVVTIVRRDAMDARHIIRRGMWSADGEGVWSWYPWAGAKSARPIAGDGDYEVMDTGESAQISR